MDPQTKNVAAEIIESIARVNGFYVNQQRRKLITSAGMRGSTNGNKLELINLFV